MVSVTSIWARCSSKWNTWAALQKNRCALRSLSCLRLPSTICNGHVIEQTDTRLAAREVLAAQAAAGLGTGALEGLGEATGWEAAARDWVALDSAAAGSEGTGWEGTG